MIKRMTLVELLILTIATIALLMALLASSVNAQEILHLL